MSRSLAQDDTLVSLTAISAAAQPGAPLSQPVPRLGRLLDVAALVLVVTGASLYAWAHLGMRRLLAAGFAPRRPGQSWGAVAEWEQWLRLSWVGLTVGLAGIAVGIAAAVVAIRKRRSVARGDG